MRFSALCVLFSIGGAAVPLSAQTAAGQQPASPPAAKKPPAFDVASVKPSKPGGQPYANFPLGPGDVYIPNGGFFSATNMTLINYILFAYKMKGNQTQSLIPQLPGWVMTEQFDIQARAEGNPGKDEMRLMMRSLLADRFQMATHNDTREVPVLAFVLAKPEKLGPQLRQHMDDGSCPTNTHPQAQVPMTSDGFPALCNGIFGLPPSVPGRLRMGARNVTLEFVADSISGIANTGRPMVDRTGLNGRFDFLLEWAPEPRGAPAGPVDPPPPDPTAGPSIQDALREQLGIKLESQKARVQMIVVDHIERPSAN